MLSGRSAIFKKQMKTTLKHQFNSKYAQHLKNYLIYLQEFCQKIKLAEDLLCPEKKKKRKTGIIFMINCSKTCNFMFKPLSPTRIHPKRRD